MDLIREMVHVIEQNRPKSFNLLIPKSSKLKKLYLLAQKIELDETDISQRLYRSGPGDKRYLMLKSNLINKLSELILIGEHSDINKRNYIKVQFECEKQLTIAKKLLFVNVYHNAEKITHKILKQAEKYHLVDIATNCYQVMRKINYLKGFPAETEDFKKKAADMLEISRKVDNAKGTTELILSELKFLRSQSKSLGKRCGQHILPLVAHDKTSPFIALAILHLRIIKAHQENDLEEWSQALTEMREFLDAYPHLLTEHLKLDLELSSVKYHLAESSYLSAQNLLNELLKFTSFQSFNRYEVLAEQFLKNCQQEKLHHALQTLKEVLDSTQYKMLDDKDQAAWGIRAAYLQFALACTIDKKNYVPWFSKWKLTEFFNLCKAIAKDKAGYNLQFVIIRILLLYSRGSVDFASEQNSLKVYQSRHLRGDLPIRSTIFYNHFVKLVKSRFDRPTYEMLSESIRSSMTNHPQYIEYCEVFKYEFLWELIGKAIIIHS